MNDTVEVLRQRVNTCLLCMYNEGNVCNASQGEFGECKEADELKKEFDKALLALEKLDRLEKWLDKKINDYEFDGTSLVARELKRVRAILNEKKEVLEK